MGIATPDLMPIIGALGDPRVLIGIYPHMGLTAGPLMGQILAMLAMDEDPVVDITPFSLQRF
jgi:glycine/D-amino acid oxidase-like deaminating enzyme